MERIPVQQLVNRAIVDYQDHTFIENHSQKLTYKEFGQQVYGYAGYIDSLGLKELSYIAICIADDQMLVSLMLAANFARQIFVPLDFRYPKMKLEKLLAQLELAAVIVDSYTEPMIRSLIGDKDTLVINIKEIEHRRFEFHDYHLDDPAYVFFTSGSTGAPKAILGINKSLSHFVQWEIGEFALCAEDRFNHFAGPAFDTILRDIFVPICCGGTVVFSERECMLDYKKMLNWLAEKSITVLHCTVYIFRQIKKYPPPTKLSLRWIIMAGEAILPHEIGSWYNMFPSEIGLVNMYGMTETTMIKTFHIISKSDAERDYIPIGEPLPNTKVYVVDETQKEVYGEAGQIIIDTEFGTYGYTNNEKANQQNFLSAGAHTIYKTNDLGINYGKQGIRFLGRKDRTVKFQSILINLTEIENVAKEFAETMGAVALQTSTSQIILLYESEQELGNSLYKFFKERCATYMIPSKFIWVQSLPRMQNGKIDYAQTKLMYEQGKFKNC